MSPGNRRLVVAVVYPDLLGTYGDGGNGTVLARRAAWRGIDVELVQATSDRPLPAADLYTVGGGEDGPQVRAATTLLEDGSLAERVAGGAVVLGVCAGFQLIGATFPDSSDRPHPGVGLLDVTTTKGTGPRAVGELVAHPTAEAPRLASGGRLPRLTGFENHGGVSVVGRGARTLAQVEHGIGNGGGDGTEGAWSGRVPGPTCTVPCWRGTRRWPTCSSGGRWPRPGWPTPRPWHSSRSTITRSWPCGPNVSRPSTGARCGGATWSAGSSGGASRSRGGRRVSVARGSRRPPGAGTRVGGTTCDASLSAAVMSWRPPDRPVEPAATNGGRPCLRTPVGGDAMRGGGWTPRSTSDTGMLESARGRTA